MKKERRNRPERLLPKKAEVRSNPVLTRRRLLIGLGVMAATGLTVAVGRTGTLENLQSILTGEASREEVINRELRSMNVERTPGEFKLWNDITPEFMPIRIATKDGILNEAQKRFNRLLQVMQQSNNPFFREAATFLKDLEEAEVLDAGLIADVPPNRKDAVMSSGTDVRGDKIVFKINLIPDSILGSFPPVELALFVVHEAEHLRSLKEYDKFLGNLPAQIRRQGHMVMRSDTNWWLAEEGKAYAKQTEAFLYQAKLFGSFIKDDYHDELAYKYIVTGKDSANKEWLSYIKSRISPPR